MTTQNLSLSFCLLLLLPLSLSQPTYELPPLNPRLEKAYVALQALKHSITSDPKNLTADWLGPHVCNYTGVFCAPAPDDPDILTVAGLDLNHGQISGTLPEDLGLLCDLALLHLNSNRFTGGLPSSLHLLRVLHELDVSNNRLHGPFPSVVLDIPSLKYLDIRFNGFTGNVPDRLFDLKLDAVFVNNNNFQYTLAENIGNSTVSVLVLANIRLAGCIPRSIGNMAGTLNQIVLLNSNLSSCLPPEIGRLTNLTVFDVSFNKLVGPLPDTMGDMKSLEQLDVAHNLLSGEIPESICELPRLKNFTYSYNYFCEEPQRCIKIRRNDDRENCIPFRPKQRPEAECEAFLSRPVHCDGSVGCFAPPPEMFLSPPPPAVHY